MSRQRMTYCPSKNVSDTVPDMTTGDCLDLMLGAGFDTFETHIPLVNEHDNYVLTIWHHNGAPWKASVTDDMDNYETKAQAEGDTPVEALWNLVSLPGDKPFSGNVLPIPGMLKALGARLWAEATRKVAMDESCEAVTALLKAKDSALRYKEARMLAENATSMAGLPPLKYQEFLDVTDGLDLEEVSCPPSS